MSDSISGKQLHEEKALELQTGMWICGGKSFPHEPFESRAVVRLITQIHKGVLLGTGLSTH